MAGLGFRVTNELLRYEGSIVPWVTRWTGQVVEEQIGAVAIDGRFKLGYPGEDDAKWRDQHGVLWQKERYGADGEPEFSQVSTLRQAVAMVACMCQVCGEHIDGPITWIMRDDQFWDGETISPPTCERCVKIAAKLCPALQGGFRTFLVRKYEIVGYWGGTYDRARRTWVQTHLYIGDDADNFIAKQTLVRFTDYEEIPS